MAMRSGGGDELNSEINVTPMVDVMLVLLIIFMVAAPMMNTGVDIELPQVNAVKIDDPKGKLILTIGNDRKLRLGSDAQGTEIKWAELEGKLAGNERLKKEHVLWVEAHKDLPYSVVVTAMAIAKNAKDKDTGQVIVQKLQLLTDPAAKIDVGILDTAAAAAPTAPSTP
jgi:biopolymer transport protein TolR